MSRIDSLIEQVATDMPIDEDRENNLVMLAFAKQGEEYATEMIDLLDTLNDSVRYQNIESIEFDDSGQIQAIHFRKHGEETA